MYRDLVPHLVSDGAVAGELVEGKRTFIARGDAEPYELPEQHTAEWLEGSERRYVTLATPGEGGIYRVLSIEDADDRIVVRVGETLAQHGSGAWLAEGQRLPELTGYPFLT